MEPEVEFISIPKPSRVAIIGAGMVGSTYAYTLLLQGIADEICLLDKRQSRAEGEALDLNHSVPLTRRAEIWAGTMEDVKDADIIMIAAGASQKPGQTRLDLLKENARIVGDVAEEAGSLAPDAVFLVTTNPVDVMTYVTMARSGVHHSHVIGSGTALDTARLRYMISRRLGIDPRSVHAYVVGEHGDSEVVAWSRASVAGTGIDEWPELCEETRSRISDDVKMAAYDVIEKKGATYYAIATALSRITEAILKDTRTVFSVSSYLQGEYGVEDVYMGVPSIVGREGVLRTIEVPLSESELRRLRQSAHVLRKAVDAIDIESMRQLSRGRALAGALSGSKSEASNEFITGRDLLPHIAKPVDKGTIRAIRPRRQMKKPRPLL
jgi:L-lactate dehydrogenase